MSLHSEDFALQMKGDDRPENRLKLFRLTLRVSEAWENLKRKLGQ